MNDLSIIEGSSEILSVDSSTAAMLARAEIDIQIATARKFPRSISKIRAELVGLATLTEEVAASCVYALPRDGKTVEGPSARFAEILLSSWGNARAASRVIDDAGDLLTAQGVFHDLERNSAISMNVSRRITGKNGKRFSPDMIVVTGNAASSIAIRNAILKGIPQAYWSEAYHAARKAVRGDFKTLANRRADALAMLQGFGAKPEDVFALLSVRGEEEIGLDHLVALRGIVTAVRDEGANLEEMIAEAKSRPTVSRGGPPPAAIQSPPPAAAKPKETKKEAAPPAETPAHNGETGEVLDVEKLVAEIEEQLAAASTRDQVLEIVESMTDGVEIPRATTEAIEALSEAAISRILESMSRPDLPEDHVEEGATGEPLTEADTGDPTTGADDFPGDTPADDVVDMVQVEADLDAAKTIEDLDKVSAKYRGRNFGEHGAKAGELYAAAEKRIKAASKKKAPPAAPAAGGAKAPKKPMFEILDDLETEMNKAADGDTLNAIWTDKVEPIEAKLHAEEKARLKQAFDRNSYRLRNA